MRQMSCIPSPSMVLLTPAGHPKTWRARSCQHRARSREHLSARCVLLGAKSVPPRAVLTSPVHPKLSFSTFTPHQNRRLVRSGGARELGVRVGGTRTIGFFTSGDQRRGELCEAQCSWWVLEAQGKGCWRKGSTELNVRSNQRESEWRKGDLQPGGHGWQGKEKACMGAGGKGPGLRGCSEVVQTTSSRADLSQKGHLFPSVPEQGLSQRDDLGSG